ncbi:hypothetical protein [Streptomyces griseosporeus]|uniref:hypothetical protein n=1 Tax=Streptomyces griseosporeus TaxID=1910 RepID=UPI0036F633A5
MPRIRLAHWYAGQKPGTELDVDDDEARHLQRDGRVAALVEPTEADSPADGEAEVVPAEAEDTAAAEPAEQPPASGRRKRA